MKSLFIFLPLSLALLGCPSSHQSENSQSDSLRTATADTLAQPATPKTASGIDFQASGNAPTWSLDIDFSQDMHFRIENGDSARIPAPRPTRQEPSGAIVYQSATEAAKLRVSIQAKACSDKGKASDYSVEVQWNGKTYTGCGTYLFPAIALHDIWALEAVNGTPVTPAQYTKGLPTLEIFPLEQRVQGHSGCNSLGGRVIIEGDRIQFSDILSTRMACPGNGEAEFLNALSSVNGYRREQLKLLLLKDSVEVLRLRKVD